MTSYRTTALAEPENETDSEPHRAYMTMDEVDYDESDIEDLDSGRTNSTLPHSPTMTSANANLSYAVMESSLKSLNEYIADLHRFATGLRKPLLAHNRETPEPEVSDGDLLSIKEAMMREDGPAEAVIHPSWIELASQASAQMTMLQDQLQVPMDPMSPEGIMHMIAQLAQELKIGSRDSYRASLSISSDHHKPVINIYIDSGATSLVSSNAGAFYNIDSSNRFPLQV